MSDQRIAQPIQRYGAGWSDVGCLVRLVESEANPIFHRWPGIGLLRPVGPALPQIWAVVNLPARSVGCVGSEGYTKGVSQRYGLERFGVTQRR